MNRLRLITLLLVTALTTHAQSTVNPLFRHIPADAEKVYQVNFPAITSKLDWASLVHSLPNQEKNKQIADYLADPASAGIDTHQGFIITESNTLSADSPRYTVIMIPLSDSGKFIASMKNSKSGDIIMLPGKARAARQGENTAFAWNASLAVMVMAKPSKFGAFMPANGKSKANTPTLPHHYALLAARKGIAVLRGFPNSPFLTDTFFLENFNDDADFHSYSRMNAGLGFMTTLMQMAHAPVDANFQSTLAKLKNSHTRTIGALRFDNGKLTFHNKTIYDSLPNIEFTPRPLNTSLIERLPQGNLLGMMSVHFDIPSWLAMLNKVQGGKSLHMIDSLLKKQGLTALDVLTAFKGDFLIAVIDSGSAAAPRTDTGKIKPHSPNFYAVFTVNNKASFDKIAAVFHKAKDSAAADTTKKSPFGKWKMAHTLRDDIYVLGPNQQATDDYFNKPGRGPSRLVTEDFKNSPTAFAIDIKAITSWLLPTLTNSPKDQQAKTILGLFDQLTMTMSNPKGNTMEANVELKMTDQQQNSLKTLASLLPHNP